MIYFYVNKISVKLHRKLRTMNNRINFSPILQKIGAFIFSIGMLLGLGTVTFGLISCGGGGGGGGGASSNAASSAMTVSSFNPPGIVASSVYQTIVISGSNFANGTTISITGSSGTPIVSSVAVTNSSTLTAVIKIDTAPTNRYVTVSVQPPASAAVVTQVLGVASVLKTYANILATTYFPTCTGCHTGTANGGLDLTSANKLNSEPSQGCSSRFRVKRGDPRRTSSFLIDKIQATSAVGNSACFGDPMPSVGPLLASEIQEIVEWVAGGAY
jgi:hypothetical protein